MRSIKWFECGYRGNVYLTVIRRLNALKNEQWSQRKLDIQLYIHVYVYLIQAHVVNKRNQ